MKKKILLGLLVVLILMQFKRIDKTNPVYPANEDFMMVQGPDQEILNMLKYSCYDCHSNETKYPWYTNVAPVSWWIAGHIRVGREAVNFSNWANYDEDDKKHIIKDCIKKVEAKHMPPKSYMLAHKEAKLSDEKRDQLLNYFKTISIK